MARRGRGRYTQLTYRSLRRTPPVPRRRFTLAGPSRRPAKHCEDNTAQSIAAKPSQERGRSDNRSHTPVRALTPSPSPLHRSEHPITFALKSKFIQSPLRSRSMPTECALCGGNHATVVCRADLPYCVKAYILNKLSRCTRCIGSHSLEECYSKFACTKCGGTDHHEILCTAKPITTLPDPTVFHLFTNAILSVPADRNNLLPTMSPAPENLFFPLTNRTARLVTHVCR
ncbi:unnamed protein product [Heligmosomoides polygyrus]|uniref:Uncharacterized protein n=1 Tax=Heligmosomoides polygyrus TaxID=6339 RepID=A0A183FVJ9_HELPZ|nr:unnamed protein product [Heligmosomoides polygyrus]